MLHSGFVLAIGAVGCIAGGFAGGPDHEMNHKASSDDRLDRLKALVGEWEGPDEDGDGVADYEVHYRLTSAGNAVIGTQFPGTDFEMVNLFHLDGEDVVMTHYCAIGNQPRLKLEASEDENAPLHFTFQSATNMASRNDRHMGELVMSFPGDDTIREVWTEFVDGEAVSHPEFVLTRRVSDDTAKADHDEDVAGEELGADDFERLFFVMLGAGPNRTEDVTDAIIEQQKAHLRHLDEMKAAGQLVLAGPFEGGGGLLILRVETMEEAHKLMDVDPHVRAGWLSVDIKPWYTVKGKL